jgi:hypothetical protein
VLDNLFFTDEARFHLSGYVIVKTVEYGVPKNHMHCMKILPLQLSEIGIWCMMS